jgi:hypothetical protein
VYPYPCTLHCLNIVGRKECTPTLFAAPFSNIQAGKSVPLHSFLPEKWRQGQSVATPTLNLAYACLRFQEGKRVATPTLFPAS